MSACEKSGNESNLELRLLVC